MRAENSFIPVEGVGETTERRLWADGVHTWGDFEGEVPGPAPADRVWSFIDRARDRLAAGDPDFFADRFPAGEQWRFFENFREQACFLDIETTGLDRDRDRVTVVSLHRAGSTTTLVRDRGLSRAELAAHLEEAGLLVTFNGKRFDVPFLESSFDLDIGHPHLDLIYPCRGLGLTGGLKRVEREVGIDRDRPDLSGRDAVRLWHEYEAGDGEALETLVSYNRDDTVNLARLAESVTDRLHAEVFEPVVE